MCVLRRVLEAAFWLLLVLGQLPGALLLLPVGLVVGTHDALAPALRDLLRWPPAEPVGPLPPARRPTPTTTLGMGRSRHRECFRRHARKAQEEVRP
jgi:hypothetical protein